MLRLRVVYGNLDARTEVNCGGVYYFIVLTASILNPGGVDSLFKTFRWGKKEILEKDPGEVENGAIGDYMGSPTVRGFRRLEPKSSPTHYNSGY